MPATIALKIGDRAVLTAQSRGRFLPAILPHDRADSVTVLSRRVQSFEPHPLNIYPVFAELSL